MEILVAYAYLWAFGLCFKEQYNKYLDILFLSDFDDDILLELEECSDDYRNTFGRLKRYLEYEAVEFDVDLFGKSLFSVLEKTYRNNTLDISEFGERCCNLWNVLPDNIREQKPFYILSYADDYVSVGLEETTRELYEEIFTYYN